MDVPNLHCPCGHRQTQHSVRYTQKVARCLEKPSVRIEFRCPRCRHLRDSMMSLEDYRALRTYWKSEVNTDDRKRIDSLGAISFAEQRVMHEKMSNGNPLTELEH